MSERKHGHQKASTHQCIARHHLDRSKISATKVDSNASQCRFTRIIASTLLYTHSPEPKTSSATTPARKRHLERVVLRRNLVDEVVADNGDILHDVVADAGDLGEEEDRGEAGNAAEEGCCRRAVADQLDQLYVLAQAEGVWKGRPQ